MTGSQAKLCNASKGYDGEAVPSKCLFGLFRYFELRGSRDETINSAGGQDVRICKSVGNGS